MFSSSWHAVYFVEYFDQGCWWTRELVSVLPAIPKLGVVLAVSLVLVLVGAGAGFSACCGRHC